jgi:two-component system sensor kinase FixL
MQQEIFQPFISTKSHGLGLGLTISRALIEAHGGKLWATQKDGQGAAFHFTLLTEG